MYGLLDYSNDLTGAGNTAFSFWNIPCAFGVGEAGNWPAAIKLTGEWFPPEERSTATGIFNSGAAIGAMVAPPLIAWLGTILWMAANICYHRIDRLFMGGVILV